MGNFKKSKPCQGYTRIKKTNKVPITPATLEAKRGRASWSNSARPCLRRKDKELFGDRAKECNTVCMRKALGSILSTTDIIFVLLWGLRKVAVIEGSISDKVPSSCHPMACFHLTAEPIGSSHQMVL